MKRTIISSGAFWMAAAGRNIGIFDRSWYGRVLVERVEGFCSEREWKRGYDEINEFEAQQIDSGTNFVKMFIHDAGGAGHAAC